MEVPALRAVRRYWTAKPYLPDGSRPTWTFGNATKVPEAKARAALRQRLKDASVPRPRSNSLAVEDLAREFIAWAEKYYQKDATTTSYAVTILYALKALTRLYGRLPAEAFRPRHLRVYCQSLIDEGRARSVVNKRVGIIKQMFKWAKNEELTRPILAEGESWPTLAYESIRDFPTLRKGRTEATEPEPVPAVDEAVVQATLRYLPPTLQAMVRLQQLSGARPNEVCRMRGIHLDTRQAKCWLYSPTQHKTAHHGKRRRIWLGPKAQAILAPRLVDRPLDAPVFTPEEAAEERAGQLPPEWCADPRPRPRGKAFTTSWYRRNIFRACDRAFPPAAEQLRALGRYRHLLNKQRGDEVTPELMHLVEQARAWGSAHRWSPNQLRHLNLTEIRRLQEETASAKLAAQAVAGHSDVRTTEGYLEPADVLAQSVMERVG